MIHTFYGTKFCVLLAVASTVAACSGGGGGGTKTEPTVLPT